MPTRRTPPVRDQLRLAPIVAGAAAACAFGSPGRAADAQLAGIGHQISNIGSRANASLDVGGAAVTYDDFLGSSVLSVTPAIRIEGARTLVLARASYSQFESGTSSLQAALAGSLVSPEVWGLRAEAFGSAGTTRYDKALAATNLLGAGRLHLAGPRAGTWVGAGLGFVSQGSRLPSNVAQLEVGGWVRDAETTYTLVVQPSRVGDVRYADAVGAARWQNARGEVSVSAGYRARARRSIPGQRGWGEVWGALWMGRRFAAVGGAGLFPYDIVQGLPGGRYVSAGLRVATRRPPVNDPALRAELLLPYEVRRLRSVRADLFVVADNDDGSRTVRVRVRGAQRVELMGDFTDWAPVPLVRVGAPGRGREAPDADVWGVTLVVSPGVHRVNVRVDGRGWEAPPGLSVVRDEFGGAVGLLVVK